MDVIPHRLILRNRLGSSRISGDRITASFSVAKAIEKTRWSKAELTVRTHPSVCAGREAKRHGHEIIHRASVGEALQTDVREMRPAAHRGKPHTDDQGPSQKASLPAWLAVPAIPFSPALCRRIVLAAYTKKGEARTRASPKDNQISNNGMIRA